MFANILQGLRFLLTYSQAKNPQLMKKGNRYQSYL